MNWIFEVYGNTYNSVLFHGNNHDAAQHDRRQAERPLPVFHALGFLSRSKSTKAA